MSLSQCRGLLVQEEWALTVITMQKEMHSTLSMSHASGLPKDGFTLYHF